MTLFLRENDIKFYMIPLEEHPLFFTKMPIFVAPSYSKLVLSYNEKGVVSKLFRDLRPSLLFPFYALIRNCNQNRLPSE